MLISAKLSDYVKYHKGISGANWGVIVVIRPLIKPSTLACINVSHKHILLLC